MENSDTGLKWNFASRQSISLRLLVVYMILKFCLSSSMHRLCVFSCNSYENLCMLPLLFSFILDPDSEMVLYVYDGAHC